MRKETPTMRRTLRRSLVTAVAAAGLVGIGAAPAMAASENKKASDCGAVHGAFADVNDDFGWLGEVGGTPGYHNGARGQDVGATGYNNSHTGCQA
jgi:hypothetical protein